MELKKVKEILVSADLISQEELNSLTDEELMKCDLYKDFDCDSLSFIILWQSLSEADSSDLSFDKLCICQTVGDVLNLL